MNNHIWQTGKGSRVLQSLCCLHTVSRALTAHNQHSQIHPITNKCNLKQLTNQQLKKKLFVDKVLQCIEKHQTLQITAVRAQNQTKFCTKPVKTGRKGIRSGPSYPENTCVTAGVQSSKSGASSTLNQPCEDCRNFKVQYVLLYLQNGSETCTVCYVHFLIYTYIVCIVCASDVFCRCLHLSETEKLKKGNMLEILRNMRFSNMALDSHDCFLKTTKTLCFCK